MLPHHILTAVSILTIDVDHTLSRYKPAVIGAGTFTARVRNGAVEFTMDSFVLTPSDTSSTLLCWLDRMLQDEHATITGYDLAEITSGLTTLPDVDCSVALRLLGRCRHQPVIDTVLRNADGTAIPFTHAALAAGIPCTESHADHDFSVWMKRRHTALTARLGINTIASWRLAMAHIANRGSLGQRVNTAIERHLADWLRRQNNPAAVLHFEGLTPAVG